MNKKLIRLTEQDLHKIVKESVNRVLNETMIDRDGNPYIEDESWPAGGGLDSRCSYNNECIKAYDLVDIDEMGKYLKKIGFRKIDEDSDSEVWQKGDTRVYYDGIVGGSYGYMTTEYVNEKRVVNKGLSKMMTNMLMPPKGYGIKK